MNTIFYKKKKKKNRPFGFVGQSQSPHPIFFLSRSFLLPRNFLDPAKKRETFNTNSKYPRGIHTDFLIFTCEVEITSLANLEEIEVKEKWVFFSVIDVREKVIERREAGAGSPYCGGPVLAWDCDAHLVLLFLSNFPQNQEEVLLHYLLSTLSSCPLIFFPKEILQHMHLGDPLRHLFICLHGIRQ